MFLSGDFYVARPSAWARDKTAWPVAEFNFWPFGQAWPARLGEITKLQVVNFARSGAANNRIVETTKNFFNDLSRLSLVHTIGRAGKGMTSLGSATKIECAVIQWTSYIRLGPNETIPKNIVLGENEKRYRFC